MDERRVKAAKISYITLSVLLCVMGVLVMIFPEVSARIICYMLGGFMIAYGAIKLVGYFSRDIFSLAFQFDLAFGLLTAVMGAIMILKPNVMISFAGTIFGIVMLADGLFKIQTAVDAKRFGLERWWLIAVMAGLSAVLAVLLIFDPFAGAAAMMILFGICMLLEGAMNLSVAIIAIKVANNNLD